MDAHQGVSCSESLEQGTSCVLNYGDLMRLRLAQAIDLPPITCRFDNLTS